MRFPDAIKEPLFFSKADSFIDTNERKRYTTLKSSTPGGGCGMRLGKHSCVLSFTSFRIFAEENATAIGRLKSTRLWHESTNTGANFAQLVSFAESLKSTQPA